MLAKLVSEIDKVGPAAIGLDFIFDTPTEKAKDEQLIETLKNIKTPIVLGAIDVSQPTIPQRNRAFQQDFLTRTGQRAGHLYFATDRNRITIADQTVRYMVDEGDISMPLRSFATVLAEVDGPKKKPASNYISWLLPPRDQARPTFTILRVAPHKDEEGRVTGPMLPPSAFELLKGKRVLIGGEFSDRDRHLTPFSVQNDERMTGVLIHAEILAQLLDGRSVYTLKFWQEALVVAIVFAFGFVAAQRWALGADETWATVMAAIVIVVVGIAMFDLFDLLIPSATVALAWPFGLWFGNIYETILKWIGWVGAKAGIVSS
jgi:adenylate cyclase